MNQREKLSTLRSEVESIRRNPLRATPGKIVLLVLALLDLIEGIISDKEEVTSGE